MKPGIFQDSILHTAGVSAWLCLLELLIVAGVCFAVFWNAFPTFPEHADEIQWVSTSDAFETFVSGDLRSVVWGEHHWTLTQPPIARYVIGAGRLLGGYSVADLKLPVDIHTKDSHSIYHLTPLTQGLLWWSRLPMAILGALSFILLYFLLRRWLGRPAAAISLILLLLNTLVVRCQSLALGEAPLFFLTLAALLPGLAAQRAWLQLPAPQTAAMKDSGRVFAWFLLWGAVGGLAAATKLNGLCVPLAGAVFAAWMVLFDRRPIPARLRWTLAIRFALSTVLIAFVVMVLVNPFLYHDPVVSLGRMIKYRAEEMSWQFQSFPEAHLPADLFARTGFLVQRIFEGYASLQFPLSRLINLGLFGFGVWYALRRREESWRETRETQFLHLFLIYSLVLSAPMLSTPLDWDRYYLYPAAFSTIFIALALAKGFAWLASQTRSFASPIFNP